MKQKDFEKTIKILLLDCAEYIANDSKSKLDYENIIDSVYHSYIALDKAYKSRY